jgi:hypothetical protein
MHFGRNVLPAGSGQTGHFVVCERMRAKLNSFYLRRFMKGVALAQMKESES